MDYYLLADMTVQIGYELAVSGDNYNTSSLGTRFLIDGVPVNNDANLQTTPAYSNYGSSFVNAGSQRQIKMSMLLPGQRKVQNIRTGFIRMGSI